MVDVSNPQVKIDHSSADFGRFHVEPLQRGFGLTLGNALRRVLLSSLQGAAITSIKIDTVYHEFATLPGVKEDTTELILNIKQLRMKCHSDGPIQLRLEAKGPGVVTASDLMCPSEVELANPELYLATLDNTETSLDMELTAERGVGYLPADGREGTSLGVIPIDAVFTPVRRVNYFVENLHLGTRSDLERLALEIQTDGTISPSDALASGAEILVDKFSLFRELREPLVLGEKPSLAKAVYPTRVLELPIDILGLSARTYNCLKRSQITKIGQILQTSEAELLALRNFGQKSLKELREKLREHNIETEDEGTSESETAAGPLDFPKDDLAAEGEVPKDEDED